MHVIWYLLHIEKLFRTTLVTFAKPGVVTYFCIFINIFPFLLLE